MKLIVIASFLLVNLYAAEAQIVRDVSGNNGQEEFVEDARNFDKIFALKIDLFRALIGEITLAGEIRVARSIGVEANVMYVYHGFLLPLGFTYDYSDEYINVPTFGGGAAVRFYNPRIFSSNSGFMEFRYKYKKLERESDEVIRGIDENVDSDTYHIIAFGWGQQFLQTDVFLMEYVIGLGYSHCSSTRVFYDQFTGGYSKETFRPDFLDDGHVPLAINVGFRIGFLPF